MTYGKFVKLLYQEIQPEKEIEKLTSLYPCMAVLPKEDGNYLVYHSIYGWCTYGYTVQDKWGYDDEVRRKDGTTYNKVIWWGKLDFINDET